MNKKGISMVMFVIAIAMVLVLITAFTTSYSTIVKSTRMREFANELNSIQSLADQYKFLNGEYPIKERCSFYLDPYRLVDSNTSYNYDILDLDKLGVGELNRGYPGDTSTLDVYAISCETGQVFYLAGVEIDKKWYYTLTDELKEKLDI
jgi:type II secretory pathway pseudopilin PulG